MSATAAEEIRAAPEERGAIAEHLALLAQPPIPDAPPDNAEAQLAEERPALGEWRSSRSSSCVMASMSNEKSIAATNGKGRATKRF